MSRSGGDDIRETVDWLLTTDHVAVATMRDIVSSVGAVALVGLLLFAISGIWPPLVAVSSPSMEPHMSRGDLVFIVDEQRFAPDEDVRDTGIVTHRRGQRTGYWSFNDHGNVIVFDRPNSPIPVIHRARFWVNESENWVETKANPEYLDGSSCPEVPSCPAPHSGFVTKGDNKQSNPSYDQASGDMAIVKPENINGRAKVRIPMLGHIRLAFGSTVPLSALTSLLQLGTLAGLVFGLRAQAS